MICDFFRPSLNNLSGQKSIKFLGGILENLQTSKGHSEINWPLENVFEIKENSKFLQWNLIDYIANLNLI